MRSDMPSTFPLTIHRPASGSIPDGMIRKAENQPFMVGQKQFTPSAYHIAKRKNVYL